MTFCYYQLLFIQIILEIVCKKQKNAPDNKKNLYVFLLSFVKFFGCDVFLAHFYSRETKKKILWKMTLNRSFDLMS